MGKRSTGGALTGTTLLRCPFSRKRLCIMLPSNGSVHMSPMPLSICEQFLLAATRNRIHVCHDMTASLQDQLCVCISSRCLISSDKLMMFEEKTKHIVNSPIVYNTHTQTDIKLNTKTTHKRLRVHV